MDDFITLTCTSCGGKLEITTDIERFACAHCGTEHLVKRGGGIVSLAPVIEIIRGIKDGTDKTASELAVARIKDDISRIEYKMNALIDGKIASAPMYRFCRYGFQALGKLNFWNVGFATDKMLEKIMRGLTANELAELLEYSKKKFYIKVAVEWLQNYKDFAEQLVELRVQLNKHYDVVNR